jgi:hypothetical protein
MHALLLHAAVAAMMASAAFSVAHGDARGWSTAQLSQARCCLSATTVGTVAIFAGGKDSELLMIVLFIVLETVDCGCVRWSEDCGCKMWCANFGVCF